MKDLLEIVHLFPPTSLELHCIWCNSNHHYKKRYKQAYFGLTNELLAFVFPKPDFGYDPVAH